MPAKSPERRCRQKLRRRMRSDANPETALEYFQVSVNIIEAKNLAWAHPETANSYVVVVLGKEKYRTSVRKKMEEPYYREYLLFEWYATLREVQRSKLWMAVMEPRCFAPPRLLGETSIDLGVIWAQSNHQVFHKWAQLSLPRDPAAGAVGFLKVDISIMCRGDVQAMPILVTPEKFEESLLPSAGEQQTANYLIAVYNAFGITSGPQMQCDRRSEKLPSTYVKVSFSGISAKTAVQARTKNPCYCEQISIVEMFPNVCQTVRLEVCSQLPCMNQLLAGIDLHLRQISHDGDNGFVPTFGPSLLHMYGNSITTGISIETRGEDGPFYRGALLVAFKTIVPYTQQGIKTTSVEPIAAMRLNKLWTWEDICIFCPILEVSMLDRRLTRECCGIAITIGDIFPPISDNEEMRKLHYTGPIAVAESTNPYGHLDFANAFPVLQLATRLPGFRLRIYRNNLVERIAENLDKTLQEVGNRLNNFEYCYPSELLQDIVESVDYASAHILKFFELYHFYDSSSESHCEMYNYDTELDQKQLMLQKDELEKIYHQIKEKINLNSSVNLLKRVGKGSRECYSVTRKSIKLILSESIVFSNKLKSLVFKSTEGWPDIVVWFLDEGSRFAYHKINARDVIFSETPEQSGKNCGRIQSIYLKPLKCLKHLNVVPSGCTCIAGRVELLMWMGLYSDISFFEKSLPQGLIIKCKEYDMCVKASIMMVECRVFIYRAKLTNYESPTPPSSFVRINVLNSVRETQVEQKTSTPIWDQVLTVNYMTRTSQDRLAVSPPEIMVEVYDSETLGKLELIGRTPIQPVTVVKQTTEHAPKLKWHDLRNGHANTGQILISALVQQMPEVLIKSTTYSPMNGFNEFNPSKGINLDADSNRIEELPRSLKPQSLAYKVDVYWWGLRDVNITRKPCAVLEIEDFSIKSDVISERKSNCNFPNGRISQTFEGHLDKTYSPPLTIKLYDSSTFGRTIFLGTKAVKNPTKYFIDWLPKYERESSLRTVSFSSSNFLRVNKTLYVKKDTTPSEMTTECSQITISSSLVDNKKWPNWKRLFCRKDPGDEEYLLLSMQVEDKHQLAKDNSETEYHDWWSRFFSSQKDTFCEENINGKIVIYNSELESQPQYNKFKDWCSTLKLYNGKKTGMPERDEELRCGFLKAGIAIYSWPPPPDTVAVSLSGVELQRGDLPCNDPSEFLVRVYIVRGLNLVPKDFNGKCNPYVVIKCGAKQSGDRNQCLQNTVNPVFGRTYEFRCSLPDDYLLTVSLYDRDTLALDDLIGSTSIDLEDRIYSKHRGRVGLSSEYNVTGPAKWRDRERPSDILENLCSRNYIEPPSFPDGNTVVVNGVEYRDSDKSNTTYISACARKEKICLNLLQKWHTLPLCGYHLVPEHVETRQLFNPEKPGVDQGKIQIWVDIFPLETGIYMPLPVDITPRKVDDYELRVIIWHVQYLRQECATKKGMDLYIKAWIGNAQQAHYTDIHYNSINGEASFNWRMIFNFQYQHSDKKLVLMERGPFTEFEEHIPPILVVQVADSDAERTDDYIGNGLVTINSLSSSATLALDLNAVPRGSRQVQRTTFNVENTKKINLFSARSLRSWWPLKAVDQNAGTIKFAGMIDLELHLLPKEKALIMPVGLGRDPPFPLPDPNRPDPYISKVKSSVMEHIFKRDAVEYIVGAIFLVFFFAVCYWNLPNVFTYTYSWLMSRFRTNKASIPIDFITE